MADALLVNIGYTELLKAAVGRERPNGENDRSFPSGHTSNAFTLATVLERHYGWKAGVPAYAVAATMGYSRIVRDKHWLSDVVAGATLGYIVGRTVVRVNGKPLSATAGRGRRGTCRQSPRAARAACRFPSRSEPRGLAPHRATARPQASNLSLALPDRPRSITSPPTSSTSLTRRERSPFRKVPFAEPRSLSHARPSTMPTQACRSET